MSLFSVYIIYSPSLDKYYIGYTIGIEKRLAEHNSGISTFTSKATDWELKWTKEIESRVEAMKEEKKNELPRSKLTRYRIQIH